MTDNELRELIASLTRDTKALQEAQAETNAQMKKTDEQMKKTEAQIAETTKKLEKIGVLAGNIANNQGDVAEEFFYNSLESKHTLAGIHYDFIDKNWKNRLGSIQDEFDIVMVNGKDVAIVETKYKAHDKDLEKLVTKKKQNFQILFPMYKDYNHHLALASFHINEELKQQALEQGVIVLERKGDVMETFLPKA